MTRLFESSIHRRLANPESWTIMRAAVHLCSLQPAAPCSITAFVAENEWRFTVKGIESGVRRARLPRLPRDRSVDQSRSWSNWPGDPFRSTALRLGALDSACPLESVSKHATRLFCPTVRIIQRDGKVLYVRGDRDYLPRQSATYVGRDK